MYNHKYINLARLLGLQEVEASRISRKSVREVGNTYIRKYSVYLLTYVLHGVESFLRS